MNLTGASAHCWLLCLLYVWSILNVTASLALGGLTPNEALTGQVPDIGPFLHFSFWEPVYYKVDENEPDYRFPSKSTEKLDTGLVLLTTRVIILHGRYLLMKQTKS